MSGSTEGITDAGDLLGDLTRFADDPLGFKAFLWPHVRFYDRQEEMISALATHDEVVCVAGNQLGKDFAAGFCCLWGFLCHREARVVTTSVKSDHLRILFGEVGRFIQTSRVPLTAERGGPLIVNHWDVRKQKGGIECKISYLRGMVGERPESLAGHHAAFTLAVIDEASGVEDEAKTQMDTWAKKRLVFGNPNDTQNFFRRAVKEGDLSVNGRPHRKVMRITALDSPNVRREMAIRRNDPEHSWPAETPGVLSWDEYQTRLATWDPVRQCIGLSAQFYEGAENLLFPPDWLNHSEALAASLAGKKRQAVSVGIDPGEGIASTSMAAVDRFGLIELASRPTPDTNVIPGEALAFARRHNVPAERIIFDRGGGGKHHADRLRAQGHDVRTVAFGEQPVQPNPRRGKKGSSERMGERESRTTFFNRRAQMAGLLRDLIDPTGENGGWGIPAQYVELRRQMAPIPLTYDQEGRLFLLPKNRKDPKSKQPTLTALLGRSPDDLDAVCMAVFCMLHPERRAVAGAM